MSVASFAIIFSHSEGSLFTLFIVSFVVQQLLSLIKSYLFIFAFMSITLGGLHDPGIEPGSPGLQEDSLLSALSQKHDPILRVMK